MSEVYDMENPFQNHIEKEIEIKTLFGSLARGFENDFEKRNLKFAVPEGLVSTFTISLLSAFSKNLTTLVLSPSNIHNTFRCTKRVVNLHLKSLNCMYSRRCKIKMCNFA